MAVIYREVTLTILEEVKIADPTFDPAVHLDEVDEWDWDEVTAVETLHVLDTSPWRTEP